MRIQITCQRTPEDQQLTDRAFEIVLDENQQLHAERDLLRQRVRHLERRLQLATTPIRRVVAIPTRQTGPAHLELTALMHGALLTRQATQ